MFDFVKNITNILKIYCYYILKIMHIYFKAPLIDNDSYYAHISEHILSDGLWNGDSFNYRYDLKAITYSWYCVFDFAPWIWKGEILTLIEWLKSRKIEDIFSSEQEVIKKELEDPEYDYRIYEAVVNSYWKNKYSLNTNYKDISFDDFKNYYDSFISKENFIITDDNYSILWKWFNKPLTKETILDIKKEPFSFEDDKYINLIFSNISSNDIWKLFCIFELVDAYNKREQRIKNKEYFYLTPYFYLFEPEKKIIFTVPDIPYNIEESFFKKWKEYVINAVKNWYYIENLKVIFPYFFGIEIPDNQMIKDINEFSFEEFKRIIP